MHEHLCTFFNPSAHLLYLEIVYHTFVQFQISSFGQQEKVDEKGEVDFKADHKFADLMQEKTEAVSDFAKKRTMQQQRQYLPIYAVRNEVRGQAFVL